MLAWESLYSIKVSGLAPIVSELAEALAKRGHNVHIFIFLGNLDGRSKINNVYYHRICFDNIGDMVPLQKEILSYILETKLRSHLENY